VYPSPEEDFGMGIIEAMARAVPVVAWRNAGPTVTVADGETGYLAEPFETADYAEKIAMLLADPERNAAMGERGLQRVRALFSWDRHVETIVDALEAAGVRGEPSAPAAAERLVG
jgi:glycosyltransferase involved in cell wall biosynthesis